ncbi:MAG: DNA-methyltransferase [Candidatus Thorarchaeota archaeon]
MSVISNSANQILHGDAFQLIEDFSDDSIDTVITSPPYWRQLRYSGSKDELGQEHTPQEYIEKICLLFNKIKPKLKDYGSLWVNVADNYISNKMKSPQSLSLAAIPELFKSAMIYTNDWICRNDIIWFKPNARPSGGVSSRFGVDYERLFWFIKSPHYYFVTQRLPHEWIDKDNLSLIGKSSKAELVEGEESTGMHKVLSLRGKPRTKRYHPLGKLMRSVWPIDIHSDELPFVIYPTIWTINTSGYSGKHFAPFPSSLVHRVLTATCPRKVCIECGKPILDPLVKKYYPRTTHKILCKCGTALESDNTIKGCVFDPLAGTGTVAKAAIECGRNFIVSEILQDNIQQIHSRIKDVKFKDYYLMEFLDYYEKLKQGPSE